MEAPPPSPPPLPSPEVPASAEELPGMGGSCPEEADVGLSQAGGHPASVGEAEVRGTAESAEDRQEKPDGPGEQVGGEAMEAEAVVFTRVVEEEEAAEAVTTRVEDESRVSQQEEGGKEGPDPTPEEEAGGCADRAISISVSVSIPPPSASPPPHDSPLEILGKPEEQDQDMTLENILSRTITSAIIEVFSDNKADMVEGLKMMENTLEIPCARGYQMLDLTASFRTFQAWIRTSISLLVFGSTLCLRETETNEPKIIGLVLVGMSIVYSVASAMRHRLVSKKLRGEGVFPISSSMVIVTSIFSFFTTISLLVILAVYHNEE